MSAAGRFRLSGHPRPRGLRDRGGDAGRMGDMARVHWTKWAVASGLVMATGLVVFGQAPVWRASAQPATATPTPAVKVPAHVPASAAVPPAPVPNATTPPAKPAEVLTPVTWRRVKEVPLALPAATQMVVPASVAEPRSERLRPPILVVESDTSASVSPTPVAHRAPLVLPKLPHGYQDPTHPVGPGQPPAMLPPTVSVVRSGK